MSLPRCCAASESAGPSNHDSAASPAFALPAPQLPHVRPHRTDLTRLAGELAQWALPGITLALVPKCPACVAAYLALATGMATSVSTASTLRIALISICLACLTFLALRRLRWLVRSLRAPRAAR